MSYDRDDLTHPLVGKRLREKWLIERVIGRGGMATVFAATHRNGMRGAIKLLHAGLADTPEVRGRFVREGRAANKVDHAGVVKLLDDDVTEDGQLFLVMELLEGMSLRQRWDEAGRKLPAAEAVTIAIEVLDILHAAHRAGVIHRDVKPDNVFLVGGDAVGGVKLLDFGIARMREAKVDATQDGSLLGTPAFMSPEQALAHWDDVDHRSDLFSLGATLRTVLSGRLVHPAKTVPELLIASATLHAEPTLSVLPDLLPEVCSIIDKSLAFDKHARWQNASEMRDALREARTRLSASARSVPVRTVPLTTADVSRAHEPATLIAPPSAPPAGAGGTVDLAFSKTPASKSLATLPPLLPPTVHEAPPSQEDPRRARSRRARRVGLIALVLMPVAAIAIWAARPSENARPPRNDDSASPMPGQVAPVSATVEQPNCGKTGAACCVASGCQDPLDKCVSNVCRGAVTRIFAGPQQACAVRSDGRVSCWGEGSLLGRALGSEPLKAPTELPKVVRPEKIVFGKAVGFAIVDGKLIGWGSNSEQLLGSGLPRQANVGPESAVDLGLAQVSDVAVGALHDDAAACAIAGNALRCWGRAAGIRALQDGPQMKDVKLDFSREMPPGLPPLKPTRIGVGATDFACAVVQNELFNHVRCWGGERPWLVWKRDEASRTVGFTSFQQNPLTAFATGPTGACFGGGRQIQCWGVAGTCASKMSTPNQPPRLLPGRLDDVAVALGHQCVVLQGGETRCWGQRSDAFGQDATTPVCEPAVIALPQPALAVAVGTGFTCALTNAGAVYCYGSARWREELGCSEPAAISKPCRAPVGW